MIQLGNFALKSGNILAQLTGNARAQPWRSQPFEHADKLLRLLCEGLLGFRQLGLASTLYSACSHWLTCAAIMNARRTPQIQCHRPGSVVGSLRLSSQAMT